MAIVKEYVKFLMGLKGLGLIDDPYIERYRQDGKLLSESKTESLSIDGLMSLIKGEFYDGNNPPPQGIPCYVACYSLTKDAWREFPDNIKNLMQEGVISNDFPLDGILSMPEYQEKIS